MKREDMPERERVVMDMLDAGKTHREIGQWWIDRVKQGNPGLPEMDALRTGRSLVHAARKWGTQPGVFR